MTVHQVAPVAEHDQAVGPRHAIVPAQGYGLAAAVVARMLDPDGSGTTARVLQPGEPVPYGAQPVVVAETTVYGAVCVEQLLQAWNPQVPRPRLVLVADAPVRPAPDARYRFRALQARLAGVVFLPYLPSLRAVEGADAAMKHQDVTAAATMLRRRFEGKK